MKIEEYWMHFFNAFEKGTSLEQELTRITVADMDMEPEDWTTTYSIAEVADKLDVTIELIQEWVSSGKLASKDIDGYVFITLAMIKEMFHYDHSRLEDVPWEQISSTIPPNSSERLREENPSRWIALCSEMGGLKALYGDHKLH